MVDLSHSLEPGMPAYPGLPQPEFKVFRSHDRPADHGSYAPGTTFEIAQYDFGGNTGTYLDAPFHRHKTGKDMSEIPLEGLVDLPGLLVRGAPDGPIGPEIFEGSDLRARAVLVLTGWAKRWGSPGYFRSGPYLTARAVERIRDGGARLVGIDCANIDNMEDPIRPAHTVLLGADIPIVEHLCGLEQLVSQPFRFFAAPPAIRGGTSFTVRAFALCSSEGGTEGTT